MTGKTQNSSKGEFLSWSHLLKLQSCRNSPDSWIQPKSQQRIMIWGISCIEGTYEFSEDTETIFCPSTGTTRNRAGGPFLPQTCERNIQYPETAQTLVLFCRGGKKKSRRRLQNPLMFKGLPPKKPSRKAKIEVFSKALNLAKEEKLINQCQLFFCGRRERGRKKRGWWDKVWVKDLKRIINVCILGPQS